MCDLGMLKRLTILGNCLTRKANSSGASGKVSLMKSVGELEGESTASGKAVRGEEDALCQRSRKKACRVGAQPTVARGLHLAKRQEKWEGAGLSRALLKILAGYETDWGMESVCEHWRLLHKLLRQSG